MIYEPQTTLSKPHPAIQAALKGHSFCDPFTLEWLKRKCESMGNPVEFRELDQARTFHHIQRSEISTGIFYKKGANWKP